MLTLKHQAPVALIKPALDAICIRMGNIHQLLTCSEGLELAILLIEDIPAQWNFMKYQKAHKQEVMGMLGTKLWLSFLKRNAAIISAKRGQRFALDESN